MCFSLGWVEHLCIYLVCIVAVVAIMRLIIPWLLSLIGGGGIIAQIINIVLWAVVAILVIYIVFGLIGCLLGSGGHFSLLR